MTHISTGLAVALAEFARSLHVMNGTANEVMQSIAEHAVRLVPGAEMAAVSLIDGGTVDTIAATDPVIFEVDRIQEELAEGPCVAAAHGVDVTEVAATSTDRQWPRYSRHAAAHGIGSTMGFQLALTLDKGEWSLGALNIYSRTEHALTSEDRTIGELLAAHAAPALAAAQLREQLTEALEGRDVIGQAKGMLMERYKVDSEQAFALLVRQSKDTNTKLRAVAEAVVNATAA